MRTSISNVVKEVFTFRWKPDLDLAVVVLSWILVVGSLSMATFVIGQKVWGGMGYFISYALVGATLFGIGIPLFWTVVIRHRPITDLGLTLKYWKVSLVVQIILTLLVNVPRLFQLERLTFSQAFPLIWMALAIGFFEAVFWRGWVQLRLENSFGIIPSILLAAVLYAIYHIGYGMPMSEMVFLFFIGLMFAIVFRATKSVLILWPFFQPGGQLITLISDKLSLPFLAFMGFVDALALMFLLVWLVNKRYKKQTNKPTSENKLGNAQS